MMLKTRGWYWKAHGDEYQRFRVEELPQFCGWDLLLSLVEECENIPYYETSRLIRLTEEERAEVRRRLVMRDQALIATAFETGGRISEVLALRCGNFEVAEDRIIVRDMPVVKRWRKLREEVEVWRGEGDPEPGLRYHFLPKYGGWVRRRFMTEGIKDRRNVLEIPTFEPLTPYIIQWLKWFKEDDYLFPSYGKPGNPPITPTRAYQIVRGLGERLGLQKWDEYGNLLNRHVCNHWFRSQRASQLASEYGFREWELRVWFSWKSEAMASRYARLAPADLFSRMSLGKIKYGR